MLQPRVLLGIGIVIALAGLVGWSMDILDVEALVVGLPVGAAIAVASLIGGGPRPVPAEGYSFDDAMHLLRRVTQAGTLVAVAVTGSAAWLWALNEADGIQVLLVFAVSLLTVYAAILTASGIVLVTNRTTEEETDGGLPPTG